MKKFLILLALSALLFSGCGKKPSDNKETGALMEASYTVNNVKVIPGTEFGTIKDSLGEPVKYSEAASCYYDGMDKMYTYDGFEIRTYPKDGRDYIQDLCISSGKYMAEGNITVGSSLKDVTSAYGDDYSLTGSMYRYDIKDGVYVYFFLLNDTVKYFGYAVDASN